MELFVVRHSAAAPRSEALPDRERALTAKGRRDARALAKALSGLGVTLDRLYHSPWRRAVETAEALSGLVRGETVVTERLAEPPGPELLEILGGERVAVVGHQPRLGELVHWLLLGTKGTGGWLDFKKSCVLWLEGEPAPGQMTLRALLPPRISRTLAR